MKIAYVTIYDSKNIRHWSGTGYYIAKCLEDQDNIVHRIGPLQERFSFLAALKQRAYRRLFHKIYIRDRAPFVLDGFAKQVAGKLSQLDVDIVFAPGPIPVAHLDCKQPLVIWTDAVFEAMVNFYHDYRKVCAESVKDTIALEKRAYKKCRLAIFSSEWAARSAIDLYHVDASKIKVVPFGANMPSNLSYEEIIKVIDERPRNICNLLFLGVEWYRKGGDIACDVTEKLNKSGLSTELSIVGCKPQLDENKRKFIKVYGFLNKKKQAESDKLTSIIKNTHFLILPSRADCTPIVFSESNSYGVPCISSNCGGIPSVIRNDINGKLFASGNDSDEICNYIIEKFRNYKDYKKMAMSSFLEYKTRLNWKVSGEAIKAIILESL